MSEIVVKPVLTQEEDSFAMAVIEYSGNLGAAFRSVFGDEVSTPVARARELMSRPEIAKRITQLSAAVEEHASVSLGSHLVKLAEIRDLSMTAGQYKTALAAEKTRGEAAGFYKQPETKPPGGGSGEAPAVSIFIGGSPANIAEWSVKHGKSPVVIDV